MFVVWRKDCIVDSMSSCEDASDKSALSRESYLIEGHSGLHETDRAVAKAVIQRSILPIPERTSRTICKAINQRTTHCSFVRRSASFRRFWKINWVICWHSNRDWTRSTVDSSRETGDDLQQRHHSIFTRINHSARNELGRGSAEAVRVIERLQCVFEDLNSRWFSDEKFEMHLGRDREKEMRARRRWLNLRETFKAT